jgi:two-component system, sensor histidine kinase and response regulator
MMDISEKHILIVDDNLKNLQVTTGILQGEDFLVSVATDGQAALSLLEKEVPDLILLDILMPDMNGFEVCGILKEQERFRELPVIFLTARTEPEDLVEGFLAGGVDYITKPFNKEELLIRVKNHLELAGSPKKILEMNRTRDKLYSIIAHDLRAPFSNITLLISLISGGQLDPCSSDFMDIVGDLEKSVHSTSSLLDNLLEWTKRQSSSIPFSPELTSVYPIIAEEVLFLKSNAKSKNISIELDVPKESQAYFDILTINTVFRNLISNAIKYTAENGTIKIYSGNNEKFVEISIVDTGSGMSEEVIHRIFKNNETHTSPGTDNERGSGLGLHLVKEFIERNSGMLSIDSTVGKGTRITVALPRKNNK